jgi:hypothetical protein
MPLSDLEKPAMLNVCLKHSRRITPEEYQSIVARQTARTSTGGSSMQMRLL